jgi:hypothetical protein
MGLKLDFSASNKGSEANYVLPKEGARPARLMTVIDLGVQKQEPYQGKKKKPAQQVILGFDLVDDLDDDGKPVRLTTGWYPLNVTVDWKTKHLHEKSKLFAIVKALDPNNKKFKGDLNNLVGLPCIVNVKLVKKDIKGEERTYANFDGCGPVPDIEGFKVNKSKNDPYVFDFDSPTADSWLALQDRLKVKVRESINYADSEVRPIDEAYLATVSGDDDPF